MHNLNSLKQPFPIFSNHCPGEVKCSLPPASTIPLVPPPSVPRWMQTECTPVTMKGFCSQSLSLYPVLLMYTQICLLKIKCYDSWQLHGWLSGAAESIKYYFWPQSGSFLTNRNGCTIGVTPTHVWTSQWHSSKKGGTSWQWSVLSSDTRGMKQCESFASQLSYPCTSLLLILQWCQDHFRLNVTLVNVSFLNVA